MCGNSNDDAKRRKPAAKPAKLDQRTLDLVAAAREVLSDKGDSLARMQLEVAVAEFSEIPPDKRSRSGGNTEPYSPC